MTTILILGSGPDALRARDFPGDAFDVILAVNNAHRIRDDWDELIHPWDFPENRRPASLRPGQRLIDDRMFVPAQNALGGFVYAGGTMAFTAGYWALWAHVPRVIAYLGCDMVYPSKGPTHFYGTGTPDPLRDDLTLASLEAKSARLMVMAARRNCAVVNLSTGPSRLVAPRADVGSLRKVRPAPYDTCTALRALGLERALGYVVPSGRYWEEAHRFDRGQIARLDRLWLEAVQAGAPAAAA
ncbi:MAG: hypothetical protein ACOY4T_01065 [Pseudomonadota bacterium]